MFLSFEFSMIQSAKSADCTSSATLVVADVCAPVSCQSLGSEEAINPDNNRNDYNCYYAPLGVPLRPCKAFHGNPAIANPEPRVNCSDLIDMPICSIFGADALPGINCVEESLTMSFSGKRGIDLAINNVDSIRFCGDEQAECGIGNDDCLNTITTQCTSKRCHQLSVDETPISKGSTANCSILPCNLLAVEELKVGGDPIVGDPIVGDSRFKNSTKQYCDGSTVKCYDFFNNDPQNLKYVKYFPSGNTMCQLHNCEPTSPTCDPVNDFGNLLAKNSAYKEKYEEFITNGNSITQFCNPIVCRPVTQKQYRCTPLADADADPVTLNTQCDECIKCNTSESCLEIFPCSSGTKKQVCSDGYCVKKIDCNLKDNDSKPECYPASTFGDDNDTPDLFDAWFYRPTPPNRCEKITDYECGLLNVDDEEKTDLHDDCGPCVECLTGESCPTLASCGEGRKAQTCNNGFCKKVEACDGYLYASGYFKEHISEILREDDDGKLCYTPDEIMKQNALGEYYIGGRTLGVYWHFPHYGDRYGGVCNVGAFGGRAIGYGGVSGNNGSFYVIPPEESSYIKGIATTNYTVDPDGNSVSNYKITGCIRYTDAGYLTGATGLLYGKRNCRYTISNSPLGTTAPIVSCGHDVCSDMTISSRDANNCSLKDDDKLFTNSHLSISSPSCASDAIDRSVRMRAKRYSNRRVCVFIDQIGAFAYDNRNYDGTETLKDGTCMDGSKGSDSICDGKNTNEIPGLAHYWRTVGMIKYIGNVLTNDPSGRRGYVDVDGAFYAEQECAKVPMRIGPPRFYNVGTNANLSALFEPALYVKLIYQARGLPSLRSPTDLTDFYMPEILIAYGSSEQKLSLGTGFIGGDDDSENYSSSPSEATIDSSSDEAEETPYSADVFLKKEYSFNIKSPILTLYRVNKDQGGIPMDPIYITDVVREKPQISNIIGDDVNMKVLISADSTNTYNDAKLKLKLIADYDSYKANGGCGNSESKTCSLEVAFQNNDTGSEFCSRIEGSEFCSKRDECSSLTYECAQNVIDLGNAINNSQPTSSFEDIKRNCNDILLPKCNRRLGITNSSESSDFFAQVDNVKINNSNNKTPKSVLNDSTLGKIDPIYANSYGWFSEICITKDGFRDGEKRIIAHKTVNGFMGKCLIDNIKSLSSANCNEGGKAPNCFCVDYVDGVTIDEDSFEIREQTAREAGLCLDVPMPKICDAIDYLPNSTDDNDPDFIPSSILNSKTNSSYDDDDGVNTSHQLRSSEDIKIDGIDRNGHAEYSSALSGSQKVYGECKGFWKYQKNASGTDLKPSLSCNSDGQWDWDPSFINNNYRCIRYSCQTISTGYSFDNENYDNNYDLGEQGDGRGLKHGFATWNGYLKRNDFIEYARAKSCLVGYEKDSSENLPTRHCDQVGEWQNGAALPPITNACVRKKCREQIKGVNLSLTRDQGWFDNGGAEFTKAGNSGKEFIASRHYDILDPNKVPNESIFYGDCRGDLGFYHLSGPKPSRACRSDGIWAPVKNQCVTNCDAITVSDASAFADAKDPTHGFASWPEVTNVSIVDGFKEETGACLNPDYKENPYVVDGSGNVIIDVDENLDENPRYNRDAAGNNQSPTRNCSYFNGGNNNTAWMPVKNPCINKCSSITQTVDTYGGKIPVTWKQTPFGEYDYHLSDGCPSSRFATDASSFDENDTGCYYLKRKCNNDGTWGDVIPMCAANNGLIGKARYKAGINSSSESHNAIIPGEEYIDAVEVEGFKLEGSCIDNYTNYGFTSVPDSGTAPKRQCVYNENNKKNVDEVYLKLVDGTSDCVSFCLATTNMQIGDANNIYNGANANVPVNGVVGLKVPTTNNCHNNGASAPVARCGSNGEFTVANGYRMCNACSGNPNISSLRRECNGANNTGHCYNFVRNDFSFDNNTVVGHGDSSTECRYNVGLYGIFCHFVSLKVTVSCNDGNRSITYDNGGNKACDGDIGGESFYHYGGAGSCQAKSLIQHVP
ncbi:MAG: hypothetical protein ACJA0S_000962 [Rickettsiales bacterium]